MRALVALILVSLAYLGCSSTGTVSDRFYWIPDDHERAMRNLMWTKLERIKIPLIEMHNVSHADLLSLLAEASRQYDPGLPPNSGEGITFKRSIDCSVYNPMFTLRETNVTLLTLIQRICTLSGAKFMIDGDTVYISGEMEISEPTSSGDVPKAAPEK